MKYAARFKLFLVFMVLGLIGASAAYLMNNPGATRAPAPVLDIKVEQAEVVMDGFHFAETDSDDMNWKLTAKRAEVKKETGSAKLSELEAVINNSDGSVVTMTADEGVFNTETKAVMLTRHDNDVTIKSSHGYTMKVKDLVWENEAKKLSSENPVTVTGDNISIRGGGLEARSDLEQIRITDGVETIFYQGR